jgi:Na+-driven multidrug efflux pump
MKLLRNLLVLAIPLVLQNMISMGVGLADNIMVGSLGEYAIAGVALANQVQNILAFVVMGSSAAMAIIAAQYWGKRDTRSMKDVISICLKICLLVCFTISLAVFISPRSVLRIFSNNEGAIAEGIKYIRIVSFAYMFFCVTQTLMAAMRCVEQVKVALVVSISTLVVSVSLNYLLIFGNLGFPRLGIQGAAISTLSARIIETTIMVVYVRFIDKRLMLRFKELIRTNIVLLRDPLGAERFGSSGHCRALGRGHDGGAKRDADHVPVRHGRGMGFFGRGGHYHRQDGRLRGLRFG